MSIELIEVEEKFKISSTIAFDKTNRRQFSNEYYSQNLIVDRLGRTKGIFLY